MKKGRVLFASLIGTTIEFFDFYIYGTAAVLVFPQLFFPGSDPKTATLQSLATFALAFFARPVGSALFGHFGDRIGRKATLVAALLTMGLSTVAIGLLPTYASIGIAAPALLALCRFGQGLGLGGEWGGAVLLATENAPRGKESWYGMFPQLGAPLGFFLSTGVFIVLTEALSDADFVSWGWRIPFLASAVLVGVGLWVRLTLEETPAFQRAIEREERVRVPILVVVREHTATVALATLAAVTTFVVFYLMTVFTLSWGTSALGFTRREFLPLQMIGVLFFAVTIPLTAIGADRIGRWPCLAVTDTREMEALGEVDEVDSARVAVGQRVRLRLEALPEIEWPGTVVSVRPNVYRQSPRNPLKVMGVKIKLDRTDASRMRPGMQFRGRLETTRIAGAVLVPVTAVFARPEGPVVFRKTATGSQKLPVVVGARSRTQVIILKGLQAGDQLLARDPEQVGS
jgi:MFS family permease